jgi:hypothetical protein
MFKNILLLIIIFYFLTVLQISFLPNFTVGRVGLNLLLLAVVALNLLEKTEGLTGIAAALIAGFFLDLSSIAEKTLFFGFYTAISLLLALLVKWVVRSYVKVPHLKRFS